MLHNFSRRVRSLLVYAILGVSFSNVALAGKTDEPDGPTWHTHDSSNTNQNTNSNNVQTNSEPIVYSQLDDIRAVFDQLGINEIVLDKHFRGRGYNVEGFNVRFFQPLHEVDYQEVINCYKRITRNGAQLPWLSSTNGELYTFVDYTFNYRYDMAKFLYNLGDVFSYFEFHEIRIKKDTSVPFGLEVKIDDSSSTSNPLNAFVRDVFKQILSDRKNNNNSSSSQNEQQNSIAMNIGANRSTGRNSIATNTRHNPFEEGGALDFAMDLPREQQVLAIARESERMQDGQQRLRAFARELEEAPHTQQRLRAFARESERTRHA